MLAVAGIQPCSRSFRSILPEAYIARASITKRRASYHELFALIVSIMIMICFFYRVEADCALILSEREDLLENTMDSDARTFLISEAFMPWNCPSMGWHAATFCMVKVKASHEEQRKDHMVKPLVSSCSATC